MLGKWGILSIDMQKAFTEDEQERELKDITDEANEYEEPIPFDPQGQEEPSNDEPEIIDADPKKKKNTKNNQKMSAEDSMDIDFEAA